MANQNHMSAWEHYLVGTSIFTLGIAGTFINSIILYRNYCKETTRKPNPLVANLCLTNLGIIFFAFPLSGLASFKLDWIWGDEWCTYYGAVSLFFGFNIMITMMMLVLDIFLQYNYGNYDSYKDRARRLMIIWGWINSIFWSAAPLLGWSRISYEPTRTSLLMVIARLKPNKDYTPISIDYVKSYRKILILLFLFAIEWSPYALVYLWPLFSDPNKIPLELSAAAPVFAKFSVVFSPLLFWKEAKPEENIEPTNT
ncbi:unnamed protein product [Brachionus calyciflorus]|uniref:Uncharacterized protein n=1 Tax=Brachionus calyciflorus TaxID=104777 RepID=A0A813NY38_9BILA|nr:unnamed protein product [Brachionus calyciflorus]